MVEVDSAYTCCGKHFFYDEDIETYCVILKDIVMNIHSKGWVCNILLYSIIKQLHLMLQKSDKELRKIRIHLFDHARHYLYNLGYEQYKHKYHILPQIIINIIKDELQYSQFK